LLPPKNLPPKNGTSTRRIPSRRDFGATILDTIRRAEIIELVCSAGHASIAEGILDQYALAPATAVKASG
jgi:hypothetical protein